MPWSSHFSRFITWENLRHSLDSINEIQCCRLQCPVSIYIFLSYTWYSLYVFVGSGASWKLQPHSNPLMYSAIQQLLSVFELSKMPREYSHFLDLPVLPFCFHNIAQSPIHSFLQVECRHNMWISLADHEIIHVKHLTETPHWQIFFKRTIPPTPFCLLHRFCIKSAKSWQYYDLRYLTLLYWITIWNKYVLV